MQRASQRGCARRLHPISSLCLLGVLAFGCKCAPTLPNGNSAAPNAKPTEAASARPSAPVAIETDFARVIRARRFVDARRLLAALPPDKAALASYRFVIAYLAVRTGDGASALTALADLERDLPELQPDILRLRAEAELRTPAALVGAAWLDEHGHSDAWLEAARQLANMGRRELALEAIEKGLGRLGGRNGIRASSSQIELRALRVEMEMAPRADSSAPAPFTAVPAVAPTPVATNASAIAPTHAAAGTNGAMAPEAPALLPSKDPNGATSSEPVPRLEHHQSEDLLWLAVEAPDHPSSRSIVDAALDRGQIVLDGARRLRRLRRLADAGSVERLDHEAIQMAATHPRVLSPSLVAYLRGRVRQVARRDQLTGANFLERAADLKADNAMQLRVDAARLHVREGSLAHALRIYDRVAQLDRTRREEAQFYAARAAAMFGEPKRGIERFSRLIERNPNGRFRYTAEVERGLSHLAVGELKLAEARLMKLALDPSRREQRPRLMELGGLIAFLGGRKSTAIERWQLALAEAPFGLAGAFAAARLALAEQTVAPFVLDSPSMGRPEPEPLPRRTNQLLAFGMEELAAEAYRGVPAPSDRGEAATRRSCAAWNQIGYGNRGFAASRSIRDAVDLSAPPTLESKWKWDCRFPRPYLAIVEEFEATYRLPKYLLHAVMRQESGFDPTAMSPVGAIGLMQLMPTTASRLAEELQLEAPLRLDEPRVSLHLGAAYLRKLLDAFEQNLVLAVAAYNAGPQAVSLWCRHLDSSSTELFAARIPYAETQKYVERVISNLLVYRYLGGLGRDVEGLTLTLPKELKDPSALY